MTKLSVNINKVATLRNARGGNVPDILKVAADCERFGADGITVHPRPDERHIRYADVYDLKSIVTKEFNIEGYPSEDFLKLVMDVKPDQVTLVPDPPTAITSNAGWNVLEHKQFLTEVIEKLHSVGIRSSIFVGTDLENISVVPETKTDRIELYTEPYASDFGRISNEYAVAHFVQAALLAQELNIEINAGHDLSLENLTYFSKNIPWLKEVSIGHALISDALYLGLETTIREYKNCLRDSE